MPMDHESKILTYRVRGIPGHIDTADAKALLLAALEIQDLFIDSLAHIRTGGGQVATIRIVGKSPKLANIQKNQWPISENAISLSVDTHFSGFTPLHDPEGAEEERFDCVAISGLGSHAFGSWKDRDSHFMWLRDALPVHLQGARVLIYGYDSKLAESRSYQNLEDVASKFRQSLSVVLGGRTSSRPLIFVAHSLGGLVLKQAMIEMASEDASAAESENFKATFAILFFGVPNQGMDIRSLHAMVRGQPNEPFTSYFDRDAGFLHQLVNKLRETLHFQDSHIISLFETKASPTAKLDSTGRWSMNGEPAVLVDRHSAKSGRSWEDQRSYLYPINCTHSDMVKFCEHDDDLGVILERLTRFVYMAPAVIRYRWEDHTEVSSPPNHSLVSGKLPSSTSQSSGPDVPSRPSEAKELETLSTKEDASSNFKLLVPAAYDSLQEQDPFEVQGAEAKRIFDTTVKGHYKEPGGEYSRVGALFLSWRDDDSGCNGGELDRLIELLEDDFHFATVRYQVPSERSEMLLISKIASFVSEYDGPECLAIIYYGGLSYEGGDTGKFKLAAKYRNDELSDPTVFFESIEMCLRPSTCDQLLILDCPFAGRAFSPQAIGRRKFELLASCAQDQICPLNSFAQPLSECMQRLLKSSPHGFSTSELYRELYHRQGADKMAGAPFGWRPLHFDESARDYGKIWLRPQTLRPPKAQTLRNRMFMTVTFALDENPDRGVMNEIARALRYLPHINQTRFEKLYDPRARLTRIVKSVIWIQRLSKKLRKMYGARKLGQWDSTMSGVLKRVATQDSSNENLHPGKRPRPNAQG